MNTIDAFLVGKSPEFRALLRTAQIAALTDVPLFITGESGSGKSLLAKAAHDHSSKHHGPFVETSCATLNEEALRACWHQARGGTLVLDDIEELPAETQTALLVLLENNSEGRSRDTQGKPIDVRLMATCSKDLYENVQRDEFRDDLYFRLKVVPLDLPRLHDRAHDATLLFDHFALEFARRYETKQTYLTRGAEQALARYAWPGNVRELRNLCERLTILFGGKEVDASNLPREFQAPRAKNTRFELPDSGLCLDDLERDMIRQALSRTEGNRSRAARLLGITRDTLLYRLKKYALQ